MAAPKYHLMASYSLHMLAIIGTLFKNYVTGFILDASMVSFNFGKCDDKQLHLTERKSR